MKRNQDICRGCLVGGAIGDSLGWPVEFLKLSEITNRYGPDGITDLKVSLSGITGSNSTFLSLGTSIGIVLIKNALFWFLSN